MDRWERLGGIIAIIALTILSTVGWMECIGALRERDAVAQAAAQWQARANDPNYIMQAALQIQARAQGGK